MYWQKKHGHYWGGENCWKCREVALLMEVLECGLLKQGSQSFSKTNSRAILGGSCRFSMAKILLFQNRQFLWKSFNNPAIVSQITCMHKFHTRPVTKSLSKHFQDFPWKMPQQNSKTLQDFPGLIQIRTGCRDYIIFVGENNRTEDNSNVLRTLSTSHPFDTNPPQTNHSRVVIHVQEWYLIILLSKKEKNLSNKEKKLHNFLASQRSCCWDASLWNQERKRQQLVSWRLSWIRWVNGKKAGIFFVALPVLHRGCLNSYKFSWGISPAMPVFIDNSNN